MTTDQITASRRTVLGLFPVMAIAGFPSLARATPYRDHFLAELTKLPLPTSDSTLTIVSFSAARSSEGLLIEAVIRLDWPPGFRQRRFAASHAPDEVVDLVVDEVAKTFGALVAA